MKKWTFLYSLNGCFCLLPHFQSFSIWLYFWSLTFHFTPQTTSSNVLHSYTFIYSKFELRNPDYLSMISSFSTSVMHHFFLTTRVKWNRTGPSHLWRGLKGFEVIVNAQKQDKIKTVKWNKCYCTFQRFFFFSCLKTLFQCFQMLIFLKLTSPIPISN